MLKCVIPIYFSYFRARALREDDEAPKGKKWMLLCRTNQGVRGKKKPERAWAEEEEEEMRRIRWGGGQEALSLSVSRMGGERVTGEKALGGGEGVTQKNKKTKTSEWLRVCVRAKWGLYKWKQMPGIMNLSGRRWGWRWWSTWLPGWLSFTLLLLPLDCFPQSSEGERRKREKQNKEERDREKSIECEE